MIRKFSIRGFTLIEMSVTLTIIALIISAGLSVASRTLEAEKKRITEQNMQYIVEAIERYVDEYRQLPCPADSSMTASDASTNFGFGIGTGGNGTCSSINDSDATTSNANIVAGAVPIYTLYIDPRYMFDGWGRRLTYIVDSKLTFSGAIDTNGFLDNGPVRGEANYNIDFGTVGDIQLLDINSRSIGVRGATAEEVGTPPNNCDGIPVTTEGECIPINMAFLLISHGVNGYGAWRYKGGSQIDDLRANANKTLENENIHLNDNPTAFDSDFRVSVYRSNEGAAPANQDEQIFDDIIIYRSKWELLQ